MSIFVPDVEMPKQCLTCHMLQTSPRASWCAAKQREFDNNLGERWEYCPLQEIKKPHGNLIDVEDVKRHLLDIWNSHECDSYKVVDMIRDLAEFEVIVKAED